MNLQLYKYCWFSQDICSNLWGIQRISLFENIMYLLENCWWFKIVWSNPSKIESLLSVILCWRSFKIQFSLPTTKSHLKKSNLISIQYMYLLTVVSAKVWRGSRKIYFLNFIRIIRHLWIKVKVSHVNKNSVFHRNVERIFIESCFFDILSLTACKFSQTIKKLLKHPFDNFKNSIISTSFYCSFVVSFRY